MVFSWIQGSISGLRIRQASMTTSICWPVSAGSRIASSACNRRIAEDEDSPPYRHSAGRRRLLSAGDPGQQCPGAAIQMQSHAVQTASTAGPIFASRWSTADESPMSVGTPAVGFQRSRRPRSDWLADALRALAEVNDEIAADGLPEINPPPRREAGRIIVASRGIRGLPRSIPRRTPRCHPLQVAGFAQFRGHPARQPRTGRVLRLHRRAQSARPLRRFVGPARRFVVEQLRALTPERMALPAAPEGLGASAMMLLAGVPTAL